MRLSLSPKRLGKHRCDATLLGLINISLGEGTLAGQDQEFMKLEFEWYQVSQGCGRLLVSRHLCLHQDWLPLHYSHKSLRLVDWSISTKAKKHQT